MLSDEEKNAIEWLKSKINEYVIKSELDENIEIILNLIENLIFKTETQKELLKYKTDKIEKQSKEIEELSDKLTQKICKGVEEEILEEYRQTIISKDKEIEEYKKQLDLDNECEIALNSKVMDLEKEIEELKENNKKKSIVIIEYQDLYEKLEDKIKAKIEEYEKEKELYDKDADREWGQYNNWDWIDSFINELQSLLEKE